MPAPLLRLEYLLKGVESHCRRLIPSYLFYCTNHLYHSVHIVSPFISNQMPTTLSELSISSLLDPSRDQSLWSSNHIPLNFRSYSPASVMTLILISQRNTLFCLEGQPTGQEIPILLDDTVNWPVAAILDSDLDPDRGLSYLVEWDGDWLSSWE